MARTYNINSFSPLYADLIKAVHDKGSLSVPHPDATAARRARFTFYDFKKALRTSPEEHFQSLSLMAEAISVTISGNVLTFSLRDHDPETQALARALMNAGTIPGIPAQTVHDEIDSLMQFPPTPAHTPTQEELLADFLPKPQKIVDREEEKP